MGKNTGWIKLHRRMMNHWVWKNPKYCRAWIYILMKCNHEEKEVLVGATKHKVKRGQFITSRRSFGANTGLSDQSVRTFWKLLEKDKEGPMIIKQTINKLTKLTVCNYGKYNDSQPSGSENANNQVTKLNSRRTDNYSDSQPTGNQVSNQVKNLETNNLERQPTNEVTKTNNSKEYKKEKKEKEKKEKKENQDEGWNLIFSENYDEDFFPDYEE